MVILSSTYLHGVVLKEAQRQLYLTSTHYSGDEIKEDWERRKYTTYDTDMAFLQNINKKNSKGREDLEATGLHENKIFNESQRILVMGVRSGSIWLQIRPDNALLI